MVVVCKVLRAFSLHINTLLLFIGPFINFQPSVGSNCFAIMALDFGHIWIANITIDDGMFESIQVTMDRH